MTKAANRPGIQHIKVSKVTINIDPHPLSNTAKGGNKIANIALSNDMIMCCLLL